MKLGNIIKIQRVFMAIRKERITPILSYKIFKLLTQIEQNQVKFYNEQHSEIVKKYAEKDGDGNFVLTGSGNIQITEDKQKDFLKEMETLANLEVDAPDATFTILELSEIKLSIEDIAILNPLIKEVDNG